MKKILMTLVALGILLSASVALAFDKGDRVIALWEDGYWYPATVESVKDDVLTLAFDDGDRATVDAERVNALDWRAGTKLECRFPGNNKNYPGVITKRKGEQVRIVYDDGDKAEVHIGKCRQSREVRNVGM